MFFHAFSVLTSHLSLAAPDVLDEAVTLGQSVQGIVGLAHGADETAEGVDVVLAGDGATRLVNLGDGDLDGGVVLGLDDAVGGRALAGDVAVWCGRCGLASLVPPMNTCMHSIIFSQPSIPSAIEARRGLPLQIDDLATVVFHFGGGFGGVSG